MARYSLAIEIESEYNVSLIAHLADIVLSEGRKPIAPELLWPFLLTVDMGLSPDKATGQSPIIGSLLDEDDIGHWKDVADISERIANKLHEIIGKEVIDVTNGPS